jgi:glycosyltransferase involved in cell wall biosynthesis
MAICHYDDTNPVGGLEKQARLLSERMRAAGQKVVMLASTRRWSRAGWHIENGVPVRYFWTYASPQVSGRYLPASLIWAVQLLLWVALHRGRIAVLHCHQLRIHAFVAAISRRLFKIPTVLKSATGGDGADIRTIGSRKYFGAPGRQFVIRNTDCFAATTLSVEEDLKSFGVAQDQIAVIPNGLNLPHSAAAQEGAEKRWSRALFLGRLAPDKNPVALAIAALEVSRETGLEVDFYGEGQQQGELEAVIAAAGPPSGVRFCGFTADAMATLRGYGYLLIASSAEGLSNSMLEGMANGVVPIATRVSGCIDHIVEGETGFFFRGTNHADLVAGLRTIAAVPVEDWRIMSRRTQEYACGNFEIDQVVRSYLRTYARISAVLETAR